MSPRFAAALENFVRLARAFNQQNAAALKLVEHAFGEDPDRASDAIRRLERNHDPALAAMGWAVFWVRQGDLPQALHELERIKTPHTGHSLWSGLALMMLGELHLEMGDVKRGGTLIRDAERILGTPP